MARVYYEHVTKRFGSVTAVDDLTLEIHDREFLVLVGPSGCGKSTVIRLLAGLEDLTEGNVYIDDLRVNDLPAKDRDIAMVFQSYALYPHMSVFDNMAFGLRMRGTPKDEIRRRVTEAADILDIEDLLKRKPAQLSGGQRQRVALGRAIVREPRVFLFDEPLSNLDAKLRVQTRTELSKLHERLGTTFIYVTHDQVEAMTMATRLAVLKDGILQQVGTPEDVYFRPDNVFVAGFIGSPSMNFFNGRLTGTADEMLLDLMGFQIRLPAERARRIAPLAGTEIICGIRPEDIHDRAFLPSNVRTQGIDGRVD
ncbi:MAG TPA: sn-glycerol-3-phosphate ABC transporter ATP-binding protein UgpC, partial [Rhodothermia bacterium]